MGVQDKQLTIPPNAGDPFGRMPWSRHVAQDLDRKRKRVRDHPAEVGTPKWMIHVSREQI